MAKKDIALKKYVVRLSAEERARLEEFVRKGSPAADLATRARILLKADVSEAGEGWSDSRIAEPKLFQWVADPDELIAAVRRGRQALDSIQ